LFILHSGNGVVLHIPTLFKEIQDNEAKGLTNIKDRMKISNRTHLGITMITIHLQTKKQFPLCRTFY